MGAIFDKFKKQQQEAYYEISLRRLNESLKPIAGLVLKLIREGTDDCDATLTAIKALARRSHNIYEEVIDDLCAEAREIEAEKVGAEWLKNLTQDAYSTLKAMGYNL